MGKCAGLCFTDPVSAGVQTHSGPMSGISLPAVLPNCSEVLVLYVTVYCYLQGKDTLRLFDKSKGYT